MALFDTVLMVDWSAANRPVTGRNSIWLALAGNHGAFPALENIRTRAGTMSRLRSVFRWCLDNGHRLLAGFDFSLGLPTGAVGQLVGGTGWRDWWRYLAANIEDDTENRSNRFELAGALNQSSFPEQEGPFWGCPTTYSVNGLYPTKPATFPSELCERRIVENRIPSAKTVWQLAYSGAVGSQSLLGIARLEALCQQAEFRDHIAIWPFETGFTCNISRPVLVTEIYPSMFPVACVPGEVPDAAQVRTVAARLVELDRRNKLAPLLDLPAGLSPQEREAIVKEEGWILGAGKKEFLT